MTRELIVNLEDVRHNSLEIDDTEADSGEERKNKFTCYICLAKFSSAKNMNKHKALHDESDLEDDIFEESSRETETSLPPKDEKPSPAIPNGELLNMRNDEKANCDDPMANKKPKTKKSKSEGTAVNKTMKSKKTKSDEKTSDETQAPSLITHFKCDSCNVYFESASDAKLHKKPNKCKFSCRKCNRKFNTLYAFVVHIMQHTNNVTQSHNSPHTCKTCQKSFENHLLLRSHEINDHSLKSDSTPQSSQASTPTVSSTETDLAIKSESVNTPVVTAVPTTDASDEFCCDLCYDVFNSEEQLKSHIEFHEQLEKKPESIVIEDDGDEVEIVEEKKDPYEIITTIKSKPKPKERPAQLHFIPEQFPILIPLSSLSKPKHTLTDEIKNMLAPKIVKQTKAIALPNQATNKVQFILPKTKQKHVTDASQSTAIIPKGSNLELRKTGPFSFALHYKANSDSNSSTSAISPVTMSNAVAGVGDISLISSGSGLTNSVPTYTTVVINQNHSVGAQVTASTSSSGTSKNDVDNSNLQLFITHVPYRTDLTGSPPTTVTVAISTSNSTATAIPKTTNSLPTMSVANSSANVSYMVNPTNSLPKPQLGYIIIPPGNSVLNAVSKDTSSSQATTAPKKVSRTKSTTQGTVVPIPAASMAPSNGNSFIDPPVLTKDLNLLVTNVTSFNETGKIESMGSGTVGSMATTAGASGRILNETNPIVIDSDSSGEENHEEVAADDIGTQSDDESDELVIDESSPNAEQPSEEKPREEDHPKDESSDGKKQSKRKWTFPMKCDGCSVVFHRLKGMRHHNKRKYRCQLCEYRCCRVSDFKQHYILEHRKFFCFRCSFLADTKTAFTEHNRDNHICVACNGFYSNLSGHLCCKLATDGSKNGDKV